MVKKIYKNLAFLIAATGHSLLLLPVFRLFKNRYPCYATPDADICIEGFPRSGNSFFVTTFQQWNHPARIAHHSHLASNPKFYARQGKPTVVLIREPAEAIASAIAWDGRDSRILPGIGLVAYVAFYKSLLKYRDRLLVLGFEEVINRPDECIARINKRFNASFQIRKFTDEENIRLQGVLSKRDEQQSRAQLNSSLPNEIKSEMKMAIVPQIVSHSLYDRANEIFKDFTAIESEQLK